MERTTACALLRAARGVRFLQGRHFGRGRAAHAEVGGDHSFRALPPELGLQSASNPPPRSVAAGSIGEGVAEEYYADITSQSVGRKRYCCARRHYEKEEERGRRMIHAERPRHHNYLRSARDRFWQDHPKVAQESLPRPNEHFFSARNPIYATLRRLTRVNLAIRSARGT